MSKQSHRRNAELPELCMNSVKNANGHTITIYISYFKGDSKLRY